jgi:hypothetical protein
MSTACQHLVSSWHGIKFKGPKSEAKMLLFHGLQGFNTRIIRVLSYLNINTFILQYNFLRIIAILYSKSTFNLGFSQISHPPNI